MIINETEAPDSQFYFYEEMLKALRPQCKSSPWGNLEEITVSLLLIFLPIEIPKKADYDTLAKAPIRKLALDGTQGDQILAGSLFEKTGALEARHLSALDLGGIPLYGMFHSPADDKTTVEEFKKYFKGDCYLDEERRFFGGHLPLSGLLRFSVIRKIAALTMGRDVSGNMVGDGTVMGGVFVLGSRGQGVLFEHREINFGVHADLEDVKKALAKVVPKPEVSGASGKD
ncbi:unnamed protein product [Cyprideis torosa]|uniref:Peroxiredoxin-like 2A n=1 Tax=Cyprideis torosa TaxID=163714 RepID=A0A7R8WHH3_9CRUS|nr:unnamed protein product [Cyprideis torosa]CAG0899415.1 unnamed protein product [Cyprideis torosa]